MGHVIFTLAPKNSFFFILLHSLYISVEWIRTSNVWPAAVWWSLPLCRWRGPLCWPGWGFAEWSCCHPCRCESRGRSGTAPRSHLAAFWPACRGGAGHNAKKRNTPITVGLHAETICRTKREREVVRLFRIWLRGGVHALVAMTIKHTQDAFHRWITFIHGHRW